jgi:hypothetical protein
MRVIWDVCPKIVGEIEIFDGYEKEPTNNRDLMPYRIDIYIGSDNGSRRIDDNYLSKVRHWADGIFPDGYTIVRRYGYYRGTSEDSLLLNVLSSQELSLGEQLKQLKYELDQDAILVTKSQVDLEVI